MGTSQIDPKLMAFKGESHSPLLYAVCEVVRENRGQLYLDKHCPRISKFVTIVY
jgi:hypothetical protein